MYLSENSNAARYKGTFSQVQHVQLEAYDSSDQLADNLSLTRENNVWFGTLDNLTVNTTYDFHAYAYDNLTVQNNDTLLFSGQTLQPISSGDNVLQIRMNPVALSGATATDIPRITRIYYPSAIAPNGSAEIRVEVEAGINDALTWEVDNATLCGSVSPSSGSYSVASIASSFSFTYTDTSACAGEINLPITVRNAELGYAMTSRVSLTISNATEIQPNVLFNPVVLQLKGEPENNGNDIRWSAIVTDDGQASNLSATWSFLEKAFSDNLTSPSGDNVTFSTLMSSYSPDDNGTLSLQLLGSEGDNLTVSWNIEKNQFSLTNQVNLASQFQELVSTGPTHSCVIDDLSAGTVRCWGDNTYGQLGTNNTTSFSRPAQVSNFSYPVRSVSVGDNHSCALQGNGEVRCWGHNNLNQLGQGTGGAYYTPQTVSYNAAQVSAGGDSTCALLTSGALSCWGAITSFSTPPDDNFVQVELGSEHACAVHDNGSLACWGTEANNKISAASGVTRAVQVSAGGEHTCAVLDNGSLACWGDDTYGQLGDGSAASTGTLVYATLDAVVSVNAGERHTCATRANGSIRCWGDNTDGQLGTLTKGGFNTEPGFVQSGGNNASWIAAGERHTCLMRSDDSLHCWGSNAGGIAALGNETESLFPVAISTEPYVESLTLDGGARYTTDLNVRVDATITDSTYTLVVDGVIKNATYFTTNLPYDHDIEYPNTSNGVKTIELRPSGLETGSATAEIILVQPLDNEVTLQAEYTVNDYDFTSNPTVSLNLRAPQNTGTTFTHALIRSDYTRPNASDPEWISYTDNMTVNFTLMSPVSGTAHTIYAWFKDSGGHIAGFDGSPYNEDPNYSTSSYSDYAYEASIYFDNDTAAPVVNSVRRTSVDSVEINFTDAGFVTDTFVSTSSTPPSESSAWVPYTPETGTNYPITPFYPPQVDNNSNASETIYAWVRDSKDNISNAGSTTYTVYNFSNSIPSNFTMSETGTWSISATSPYSGSYSLKSAPITDGQKTCTAITAPNTGVVSFRYRVSSESCCDKLRFYVGDSEIDSFTGGWSSSSSYSVTSGQDIKWCYEKDGSAFAGEDAAYIDALVIP